MCVCVGGGEGGGGGGCLLWGWGGHSGLTVGGINAREAGKLLRQPD